MQGGLNHPSLKPRARSSGIDRRKNQPARRSARLAGRPPPVPSAPTVEVDQSPSLFGSAVDFQSQAEIGSPAWLPKMHLAVAPPKNIVAGVVLTSPVLVTFEIPESAKGKDGDEPAFVDFNGCWAFLSLVAEDRKEVLAPPRKDLLEGIITDSIHELDSPQQSSSSNQIIGYAAFKDLKISETGSYCFGVNIVDMNNTMSSAEVKITKVIHSETFQVVEEVESQVPSPPAVLMRLREIGVEI